jgi:hypothetical protein
MVQEGHAVWRDEKWVTFAGELMGTSSGGDGRTAY